MQVLAVSLMLTLFAGLLILARLVWRDAQPLIARALGRTPADDDSAGKPGQGDPPGAG